MCMAKRYAKHILDVFDDIEKECIDLKTKLRNLDVALQDINHYIENNNFNASQGYILAKSIKELRKERRNIKNELDTLSYLKKNFVNKSKNNLKSVNGQIQKEDEKLCYLTENKIYNPRIIDLDNIDIYEILNILNEKVLRQINSTI